MFKLLPSVIWSLLIKSGRDSSKNKSHFEKGTHKLNFNETHQVLSGVIFPLSLIAILHCYSCHHASSFGYNFSSLKWRVNKPIAKIIIIQRGMINTVFQER